MTACCPVCGGSLADVPVTWNAERGLVVANGRFAVLPHQEGDLLQALIGRYPNVVTKEALHSDMYGLDPNGGAEIKIVDVLICKLRKKLAPLGIEIETHWGRGYSLSVKIARAAA